MSIDFETLSTLPHDVQGEIIREAELLLQAQLTVAIAADQRALAFGGLLIAAATGSVGGGVALLVQDKPDFPLAGLAIIFACGVMYAAFEAVRTVVPTQFCLPGNQPASWIPSQWAGHGTHPPDMARARIEQAVAMDKMIVENRAAAARAGRCMRRSYFGGVASLVFAAILLAVVGIFRFGAASSTITKDVSRNRTPDTHVLMIERQIEHACGCGCLSEFDARAASSKAEAKRSTQKVSIPTAQKQRRVDACETSITPPVTTSSLESTEAK